MAVASPSSCDWFRMTPSGRVGDVRGRADSGGKGRAGEGARPQELNSRVGLREVK